MTIDERLEALTRRHEALTKIVELMGLRMEENFNRIAGIFENVHASIKSLENIRSPAEAEQRMREMYDREMCAAPLPEGGKKNRRPRQIRDLSYHLSYYRHHTPDCKGPRALDCGCPLWVKGHLRGKYICEAVGTAAEAEQRFRETYEQARPDGGGKN